MIFYGRNVLLEALSSDHVVCRNLFLQQDIKIDEKISQIIELAKNKKVTIQYLSSKEITKSTNSNEHQGVYGDIQLNNTLDIESLSDNENFSVIYISDATYEHNIGAIIRSAEVSGVNAVILPKDIKITPTVARASVGALFHIPIMHEAIFNSIKKFKDNGFQIIGIERDGTRYFDADLTGKTMFIIGGEDKSLSDAIRKKCDLIAEIPQLGKVNSLNMSVAASIVMFERLKQITQ
jgi:23S rRNA (guanosine2251-2'-O)-methyltransferase